MSVNILRLVSGSLLLSIASTRFGFSGGHTHLAIWQWRKECCHESSAPHNPQQVVVDIFRWCITSAVGIDCWANLHRKNLSFGGTSTLHIAFHDSLSLSMFEESARPSSQASLLIFVSTNMRYEDLPRKHLAFHVPKTRSPPSISCIVGLCGWCPRAWAKELRLGLWCSTIHWLLSCRPPVVRGH